MHLNFERDFEDGIAKIESFCFRCLDFYFSVSFWFFKTTIELTF